MHKSPFITCDLEIIKHIYRKDTCKQHLNTLMTTANWSDDYYLAFGRKIMIPRLQAWYADEGIRYSYSNNLLGTQAWIQPLIEIRAYIEEITQQYFNSVLLTFYRDGNDLVSWHADDEKELGNEPYIASLSLGADREFHYRHKRSGRHGHITLENGDLLLMKPRFQADWEHCIPAQDRVTEPRINLTYRRVNPGAAPDRSAPSVHQASWP